MPEQSTPERSAKDEAPAAAESDERAAGETEEPTDAKSVFAAALAKKKAAGAARSAHLDGHGGVGGATANHKATRTFRRKSG